MNIQMKIFITFPSQLYVLVLNKIAPFKVNLMSTLFIFVLNFEPVYFMMYWYA